MWLCRIFTISLLCMIPCSILTFYAQLSTITHGEIQINELFMAFLRYIPLKIKGFAYNNRVLLHYSFIGGKRFMLSSLLSRSTKILSITLAAAVLAACSPAPAASTVYKRVT